jgi:hypothetical protein
MLAPQVLQQDLLKCPAGHEFTDAQILEHWRKRFDPAGLTYDFLCHGCHLVVKRPFDHGGAVCPSCEAKAAATESDKT